MPNETVDPSWARAGPPIAAVSRSAPAAMPPSRVREERVTPEGPSIPAPPLRRRRASRVRHVAGNDPDPGSVAGVRVDEPRVARPLGPRGLDGRRRMAPAGARAT